ncbi:hypothetical protein HK097_009221 [Rhizophlyctis rosea]|uniref:DNA2/NAM7 helicase-like C-terminal domain-containing protein n=1 Tax=Rhizophlyctis rosea TaxID=64517 RepID=A0AAD5S963_9FUNG|nr:hypothetical protein HK097_009221 [Rhizophlyctis rosea]
MSINDLARLILSETRKHYFLVDVALSAPDFQDSFASHGSNPISFGVFKPDFIEIHVAQTAENHRTIDWRVIDAKASRKVKISHQVQVGFYHLCIQSLLQSLDPTVFTLLTFAENDAGEVWIPEPGIIPGNIPVPNQIFPIALLRPILETLLFVDLPRILSQDLPSVRWHYNPLCAGCDYSNRCRTETITGKTISNIPHLSFGDHKFMSQSLAYYRRLGNTSPVTDLEDLHTLVHSGLGIENGGNSFVSSMPATAERLGMLMKVQGRIPNKPISQCDLDESPILKAATEGKVAMLGRRTLIFPHHEDIAVFISLGLDPNTEQLYAFSISVIESTNGQKRVVKEEDGVVALGDEADFGSTFTARLAGIIQDLLDLKGARAEEEIERVSVQFYVYSRIEYDALTTLLVTQACRYDDGAEENKSYVDARICIGAILDHSDVLLTTVQPELISSSLLFSVGSGKLRKNDLERYVRLFEGRGVSLKGQTVEMLKERLKGLLEKVSRGGVAMGGKGGLARKLPKVVVVHEAVGAIVAMPTPGYFQLDASKAILIDGLGCGDAGRLGGTVDQSIEEEYKSWKENDPGGGRERLRWRRKAMQGVVDSLRERVEGWCNAKGVDVSSILPNSASAFVVAYIELVKNRHLKRLLFMRQFELMTELTTLIQDRTSNTRCIDLNYLHPSPIKSEDFTFVFTCTRGSQFLDPETDEHFKWILVRDGTDAEMAFDDLKYQDTYFTRLSLAEEDKDVREAVCFARVVEVEGGDGGAVKVKLRLRMAKGFTVKGGKFKLRQRLVDYNTKKIVKNLVETEADAVNNESVPLFLQILDDVNKVGRQTPANAKEDTAAERNLFTFYNEYYSLVGGSKFLQFQTSQRRAFQAILNQSLTIVWGPPGHGKTHTLALSTLRLMELSGRRRTPTSCRILMTACTHAAIDTFVNKLSFLLQRVRKIENMERGTWRDQVEVHRLTSDQTSAPSPASLSNLCVVAGTVWSIYRYMENHKDKMDFDVLMIDEASQMPVADAAIPVRALSLCGRANLEGRSKRIILGGDHLQLSPVLRGVYPKSYGSSDPRLFGSILDCVMRDEEGLAVSLSGGMREPRGAGLHGPLIHMLSENFRMVRQLCNFTNSIYRWGGDFEPMRVVQDRDVRNGIDEFLDDSGRMNGLDRGARRFLESVRESENALVTVQLEPVATEIGVEILPFEMHLQMEAKVVCEMVKGLRECFPEWKVFVVTPHRAQRAVIGAMLRRCGAFVAGEDGKDDLMRVDTVERMQGDEAEIVVACYGFTTHLSQLENELDFVFHRNRLNVALSRAKNLCVLIASKTIMEPPIAALATPERREAFAHLKLFAETSHIVPWRVSVDGPDIGGPLGDEDDQVDAMEEDVWVDAIDDLELLKMLEGVEKMQLGTG